jgi:hypothetical protein
MKTLTDALRLMIPIISNNNLKTNVNFILLYQNYRMINISHSNYLNVIHTQLSL